MAKNNAIDLTAPIIDNKKHLLILATMAINLISLYHQFALWLITLLVVCFLWRVYLFTTQDLFKYKWLVTIMALVGCFALVARAPDEGVLKTMVQLLCFAYGLKVIELKRRKDLYQFVCIGIFILSCSLIFNQALEYFVFFTLAMLLNLTVLASIFMPHEKWHKQYYLTAKVVLQSLPLAVVLFLFFPKISPLWQMPNVERETTGLSQELSIGDVSKLVLSNKRAFRVDFIDQAPQYNQLYWRTLVLDYFDGTTWRKANNNNPYLAGINPLITVELSDEQNDELSEEQSIIRYEVVTEKSFQPWLFSLNKTQALASDINVSNDYTLFRTKPIEKNYRYQAISAMNAPLDLQLNPQIKQLNLLLPKGTNPRLTREAFKLYQQSQSPQAYIDNILQHFYQQPYAYTLEPPPLGTHQLDSFYFDTQAGFCEYYASAFTFMMRVAGIPARVVVGYMGGEYNESGNFYTIKQKDAHAWSEVWLSDKGWVRFDPTAWVNPSRVESGFSPALSQERSELSGEFFNSNFDHVKMVNLLREQFQKLDYQWTKWVIGFNAKQQLNIFNELFGRHTPWKMALIIALTFVGSIMLVMFFNLGVSKKKKITPSLALYLKLLSQLNKKGLAKPHHMTTSDFIAKLSRKSVRLAQAFKGFNQCFNALHYQQLPPEQHIALMKKMKREYKHCQSALARVKR